MAGNFSGNMRKKPKLYALPTASPEQNAIIDAVKANKCVKIVARAGTGKTTTAMLVVESDHRNYLILTYNRPLSDECKQLIKKLGLKNVVCRTYHAQIGYAAAKKCSNDTDVLQILRRWNSGVPVFRKITEDCIILDELQDIRPSYHMAILKMLPDDPQLLLLGDPKQTLYDYGDDAASAKFLNEASTYFPSKTRAWAELQLTVSYRLSNKIAAFVNFLWGTDIVAGNYSSDLPVEYWCLNLYGRELLKRLRGVFETEKPEDIVLLNALNLYSAEGKERPLQTIINKLLRVTNNNGVRSYNFACKKSDEGQISYVNKIRAWTFHASKGCTMKCVIIFGLDAYAGRQPNMNSIGVAVSRSSCRLIVIHSCDGKNNPQPYCAPLCSRELSNMISAGIVEAPDGIPQDTVQVPAMLEQQVLSVTGITHLTAATIERLLDFGEAPVRIDGSYDIHVALFHKFSTGSLGTEENVSAIYGVALPLALQWHRTGRLQQVEALLTNPIHIQTTNLYKVDTLLGMLASKCKGLSGSVCEEIQSAFPDELTLGSVVLERLRLIIPCHEELSHICIGDSKFFDENFAQHIPCVRAAYEAENKTPQNFALLANALIAVQGTHELFVQIGDRYDWVDCHAFEEGIDALRQYVPVGTFEKSVRYDFEQAIEGNRRRVKGFVGIVDLFIDPKKGYELKFVSELTVEHELQALLYAAIMAVNQQDAAECTLFNARTGQSVSRRINAENALNLLYAAATNYAKY